MERKIIDTHAHLNHEDFNDFDEIINSLSKNNIEKIINVSYDLNSSKKAVELTKYNNCYAAIGFHPYDADKFDDKTQKFLIELANNKKVIAIGETGLDYHLTKENSELQKIVFIKHINLANQLNLPIIVHMRDATQDCMDILKSNNPIKHGILHCFSESKEIALEAIKLGFYISFSGNITFKNAKKFDEIIKSLPKNKILIETDCPYLAPHPMRGKRNEPKFINFTLNKINDILGEDMSEQLYENSLTIFNLK